MMNKVINNYGIVLLSGESFGGAQKRFSNLFGYIYKKYPNNIYYFVSIELHNQLKSIYKDYPFKNVITIGKENPGTTATKNVKHIERKVINRNKIDYLEVDKQYSMIRKTYWFYKNYYRQLKYFKEIDYYRTKYNIDVFLGVYSGILPLYFYLKNKNKNTAIIFSDMDSWFSEVLTDKEKMWYRKYYSFNYGLENSDYVDFLSPYILKGIKERDVKIKDNAISIAPCSFIDYSLCKIGGKNNFEIAFAGRLEPDKNPILFLKAVKIISSKYPNIKFHLLGDGSLYYEVQKFIKENQLENSVNYGFHNNPPEIFAETSVFVSIQSTNNYPSQSVLEAMACGNAIIASDVGDTQLFINENNGILIDLTVDSLILAMERLINDTALTKKMGEYAAEFVRKTHSIEKAVTYYLQLFEKASQKRS